MANFPSTFTENPVRLEQCFEFDDAANTAVATLAAEGLYVVAGLRRADVPEMTAIADQEGVREYCPKDIATRWGSEPMAETQLTKNGGRAVFRLVDEGDGETAGYGWTGKEDCTQLPMCDTTFAVRINQAYQRRHLAAPFTRLIVAGSVELYDASKIGLETWGSNTGAVMAYIKAGAALVTTKDDERPTLQPRATESNGLRRDVRLFMQFPSTM